MDSALPAAGLKDLLLLFLGKRRLFKVIGNSMLPCLQPEQRIVAKEHNKNSPIPDIGSIVVCRHPSESKMVITKRVKAIEGTFLELRGDNQDQSIDSRHFGKLSIDHIIGVAESTVG